MRRPNPIALAINEKLSRDITHLLSVQEPKLLDRARRAEPAWAISRRMPVIIGLAGVSALILLAITGGSVWWLVVLTVLPALAAWVAARVVARDGELAVARIREFVETEYNATLVRVTQSGSLVIEADRLLKSTPASDLRAA